MFENLGNLTALLRNAPEIMRQMQQMQGRMAELKENLAKVRVEGTAGGGMVRVEASGQQKILRFSVEESLLKAEDREMLEDLLAAATNQALEKTREAAQQEMTRLAGDVDLSAMGDMLAKMGLGSPDGPGAPPSAS
jgi:DNA-binding YbaB/EbfC family protein